MNETLHLFDPVAKPLDGMRSSVDPSTVRWRLIDNWRIGRNSVQGRLGCDELTSGVILANGAYKGSWTGRLNGTEYLVVALRASSKTSVYKVDLTTGAATQLTASSPDTRFDTDGDVVFAPYRELGYDEDSNFGKDYLYMTNGTADLPRTSTTMNSGSVGLLYNHDPELAVIGSYRPIPKGYVYINDKSLYAATDSGANVTTTESGTAPLCEVTVDVTTSTTTSDWVNIAFDVNSCVNFSGSAETTGNSLDLSASRQLWILFYDPSGDYIHNYCNVEVTQSSQVQIYDATGVNRIDPSIVPVGGGYYLAGFHLDGAIVSTLSSVTGIRLEFARTFSASRSFKISGIFASGRVPQGTSYEMSFASSGTRSESPGLIIPARPTAAVSEYGCSRDISYKLPDNEVLWYAYRVDWGGTLPAGASNADATFLYRKEPGDARAIFTADMGVSNNPFNDNVNSFDRASYRPSPSPGGTGPLSGQCIASWNDRLAIGAVYGGRSQVWISDQYFPLRFRALVSDEDGDGYPDLDSGLSKSFPGEDVKQLVPMPGTMLGRSPLIAFTTNGTYRFEGGDSESLSRPTLCNQHGTSFPWSVSCHRGLIYYLDNDLIARRFAGGIETDPISLYKVDDQFENGDMTECCSVVYKDRYYLAHRASGASINQRVMVYESQIDAWCRDSYTTAAQNWAGLLVTGSGSTRKLMGVTEEGRVYHLEKSGQLDDDGTAISGTLTTGELHDDGWTQRVWGSVGVVVDDIASGSWTVARTNENNTSDTGSGPGTINVDVSTTRAYRYETSQKTGNVDAGIRAAAIKISITGKVIAGKFLKAIVMKVSKSPVVPKGDRP